jgi:excisionase family DNA binding protein
MTNDPSAKEGRMSTTAPEESTEGRGIRGRWFSINAACDFLGVDQSTLRRWSDAGKIPVFRTPGGHRRYGEDDLRALVGESPRKQERPRVSRQELTDRSLSGYEEEFWRGARDRRWMSAYTPARQEEMRQLGRRLVTLAVKFASSNSAADRASFLEEGRTIGEQYGLSSARAGLACAEAVEAFLYFRAPVMRSVTSLVEDQGLASKRAARLFFEIGQFMDQILVATVAAHELHGERVAFAVSQTNGTSAQHPH